MICKLCKDSAAITKGDKYCKPCRKILNARRSTPDAKKKRADKYYWDVHVPKLQARLNAKYPMEKDKVGVFYGSDRYLESQIGLGQLKREDMADGMMYNRLTWEGYQIKTDQASE